MAKISASEDRVVQVNASPEKAYAFFADPEQLGQAFEDLERCQPLGDGKVRWVFEEKNDQGIRFQPDYVVAYDGDGVSRITWTFVEGNMENNGEVHIKPLENGGSEIRYRETILPDLPITPIMAQLLKPLVAKELRKDLGRFLDRAQEVLAN